MLYGNNKDTNKAVPPHNLICASDVSWPGTMIKMASIATILTSLQVFVADLSSLCCTWSRAWDNFSGNKAQHFLCGLLMTK